MRRLVLACFFLMPALSAVSVPGPSLDSRARSYLGTVYPQLNATNLAPGKAATMFARLEFFYDLGPETPFELLADIEPPNGTARCRHGYLSHGILRRPFSSRFPETSTCRTRATCLQALRTYVPTNWVQTSAIRTPVFSTDNMFLEVFHLAWNAKRAPGSMPTSPEHIIDSSLAGWWYFSAPGSGIFYRTGRALFAPTKMMLLLELLTRMASSTTRRDLELVERAVATYFPANMPEDIRSQIALLERTVQRGCVNSELFCNSDNLGIIDYYDPLLIGVGRLLGFESLGMTSSIARMREGFVVPQIVDLRLPPSALFNRERKQIQQPRYSPRIAQLAKRADGRRKPAILSSSYVLFPPRKEWTRAQSAEWVSYYLEQRVLTLRDPAHTNDEERSRLCDFSTLTEVLSCAGHVSSRAASGREYAQIRRAPPQPSPHRTWSLAELHMRAAHARPCAPEVQNATNVAPTAGAWNRTQDRVPAATY